MKVDAYMMDELVRKIPHQKPFRFIDKITYVDDSRIEGHYQLCPGHSFYQGHFPDCPITPGVILIEVMAQIGLVAFGLYLLTKTGTTEDVLTASIPVLASADVKFCKKVLPGDRVFVKAEKQTFRHGKLVCRVMLLNNRGCTMAEGSITGFIAGKADGVSAHS